MVSLSWSLMENKEPGPKHTICTEHHLYTQKQSNTPYQKKKFPLMAHISSQRDLDEINNLNRNIKCLIAIKYTYPKDTHCSEYKRRKEVKGKHYVEIYCQWTRTVQTKQFTLNSANSKERDWSEAMPLFRVRSENRYVTPITRFKPNSI